MTLYDKSQVVLRFTALLSLSPVCLLRHQASFASNDDYRAERGEGQCRRGVVGVWRLLKREVA